MRKFTIILLIYMLALSGCGKDIKPGENMQIGTDEQEMKAEIIYLDTSWEYSDYTVIHNEGAPLYRAKKHRKNIVIGIDAGHGTTGAEGKKIYCHPDKTPKTTGGSTAKGAIMASAQSDGMTFNDGTGEGVAVLRVSTLLRDKLLDNGYDVLMLRDSEKVELDLLSRVLIANNYADCHISIHFDGDGLDYDKGAFYIGVPEEIKSMPPVDTLWEQHEQLGESLINGLRDVGVAIFDTGSMKIDLMQTSYSTIPSVDVELGNQATQLDDSYYELLSDGLLKGIKDFY